ncbi:MAG TPA: TetR/AcrR family transcriptional regulator [Candidatus Acidoferrales bacterium]|jgi:AcrR family transcriptional regulator|nr:TetR/AcrR family transcriptional regulator [Candidatus Acidoferrales bacterium]
MLHQDCERLDPRIRRTRQLLQDALKRLLETKEFEKITIQDIAEAATLNRATFYAHYPDKFALLEELIRVSFLQLLDCRKVSFDGSCATAFQPIILAVCDYLAELQKSHSAKQHQFEAFVEGTVIDQLRVILMDGFQKHPVERNIPPELIAATASWAIFGAAKQWVNTPERVPAEQFAATAIDLVHPILMAGVVPVASH